VNIKINASTVLISDKVLKANYQQHSESTCLFTLHNYVPNLPRSFETSDSQERQITHMY